MNVKISQLEPTWGLPLTKFDVLPIVNANETKKVTLQEIGSYVLGGSGIYSFIPAKANVSTGPNPNEPAAPLSELDLTAGTFGRVDGAYYSPAQTVTLPLLSLTGKENHACLVKVSAFGILLRQTGTIGIQFRRNGSEPWSSTDETVLSVKTSGSAGGYRVYESSTELVYINIPDQTFQWRFIDPDTTSFTNFASVSYKVQLELLGFYITST